MTELQEINNMAKRPIDIWTNYLYYPLSVRLVYLLRNTSVSPNGLTITSLAICLAGCLLFGKGTRNEVLVGLVLVQFSYVLDCADGQLARYRKQFSDIGRWLDQVCDRVKEFAIYFSLAWGVTQLHPADTSLWKWVLPALFTLYFLEYLGQVHFEGAHKSGTEHLVQNQGFGNSAPRFRKLQSVRSFIPFRGFIIGEQYFALLVFVLLNAIVPLFYFVSIMGALMCLYRPTVQLYKYKRGYL